MVTYLIILLLVLLAIWRPILGIVLSMEGYVLRGCVDLLNFSGGGGSQLAWFLLPLAVFGAVAYQFLTSGSMRRRYKLSVVDFIFILFGIVLFFGSLYAPDVKRGFELSVRYWLLGISYYFVARIAVLKESGSDGIDQYLHACWIVALVLGGIAIYVSASGSVWRLSIGNVHPIAFSLLIGMALLVNLYWLIVCREKFPQAVFKYAALIFLAYIFIATNTRGTTVSLFLAVCVMLLLVVSYRASFRQLNRLILLGVGGVAGLIALISIQPEIIVKLFDNLALIVSEDKGKSISDRLMAYNVALNLFFQNPLTGVGTGGFAHAHFTEYPHNIFLEVASENGILGLLPFLGLLFFVSLESIGIYIKNKSTNHHQRLSIILIPLLVYFFVEAQFSMSIWMQKHLYVAMALVVGYRAIVLADFIRGSRNMFTFKPMGARHQHAR